MQAKMNTWLQYVVLALLAAILVVNLIPANITVDADYPTADEIAAAMNITVSDSPLLKEMYSEMFKDDFVKSIAEDLALDEIDSKDFKLDIIDALNAEGVNVESYKDIEKIVVKDVDTTLAGEDATVSLELKVYYFVDGDEDETGRAVIDADIAVEKLVEDDSYEDAEVEDFEVEVSKVYD